jgi:hypothetical protein
LQEGAVALRKLGGAMHPSELARVDVHAVIFVDGLRMDLAQRLSAQLRDAGATVSLKWRWAGGDRLLPRGAGWALGRENRCWSASCSLAAGNRV